MYLRVCLNVHGYIMSIIQKHIKGEAQIWYFKLILYEDVTSNILL